MRTPPTRARTSFATLAALLILAASPAFAIDDDDDRPAEPLVEVMVLGTYHMGNPGLDLNNMQADDVTTPKRQKELAEVARLLAKFKPTKIAVEAVSDAPDRAVAGYAKFTPADLAKSKDERVQIAYRLAQQLGHATVYGIDEHSDTVDYFPFDPLLAFAKRTGREAELAGVMATGKEYVANMEKMQRKGTVADLLLWLNEPTDIDRQHGVGYLGVLPVGAGREQPGAELNAMWFLRNAKIFAKLSEVTQPGDRVLVVFGAGHNYWLRYFARATPGFQLAEPNDFLGNP